MTIHRGNALDAYDRVDLTDRGKGRRDLRADSPTDGRVTRHDSNEVYARLVETNGRRADHHYLSGVDIIANSRPMTDDGDNCDAPR